MNPERTMWLETTLREAFAPTRLDVEDESAKHRGHEGARGGASHYKVVIVSERFAGMNAIARQRAVYAALGAAVGHEIHALAMTTLTPAEDVARGVKG